MVDKFSWCCKKVELIEPKDNLNKSYLSESEQDLGEIANVGSKWKVIIAYYSCYEAVYSLFMKCGIKCEIHDCTIELMSLFGFSEEEQNLLRELKELREGNQYYLKRNEFEQEQKVKEFVSRCKEISSSLNQDKINEIRGIIK